MVVSISDSISYMVCDLPPRGRDQNIRFKVFRASLEQLFYSFRLDEAVPHEHPIRKIAAVFDLSWVRSELAPFYPEIGRPSIDPELMIRMLIIGYVFAIRSERAICREVQVNLAYRWFCGLL